MNKIISMFEKTTQLYTDLMKKISNKLDSMSKFKLMLLLFLSSIILVLITSQFIEKSGDAVYKWGILRYYVDFGQWYPDHIDHHQGRWAINLPVILLMKIFGTSAIVYYIFPMAVGIAGSLLTYKICTQLGSRTAGVAAFLIFAIFPLTTRENTQFLPMLPATTFVLAGLYFILKWLENSKLSYVLFAAIMLIFAYGCKITSLYWALAFVLFMAIYKTDKKIYFSIFRLKIGPGVIVFSLTIIAGLLIETLLINYFWGFPYGRLQLIAGSHLHNRANPQYCNFFVWLFSFLRPLSLRGKYFESVPCFFIFILGIVSAFLCLKKGNISKKFISFSLLVAYLLQCYMVYKVFPFLHPEKAHSRYFMVIAVACIIMYCTSRKEWNELIWSRIPHINLTHFLQFAVCMAWLVTSLIYVANSWLRNGTILNAVFAQMSFSQASQRNLATVSLLNDNPENGKLDSYDRKNTLRWMVLFGPSKYIPDLQTKAFELADDEEGQKYLVLMNADSLKDREEEEVLVIKYLKASIETKSMQKQPLNFYLAKD